MNKYAQNLGRPHNRDNSHNGTINGRRSQERARSEAAAERAEARAGRSYIDQLARLDAGAYVAKSERSRLAVLSAITTKPVSKK